MRQQVVDHIKSLIRDTKPTFGYPFRVFGVHRDGRFSVAGVYHTMRDRMVMATYSGATDITDFMNGGQIHHLESLDLTGALTYDFDIIPANVVEITQLNYWAFGVQYVAKYVDFYETFDKRRRLNDLLERVNRAWEPRNTAEFRYRGFWTNSRNAVSLVKFVRDRFKDPEFQKCVYDAREHRDLNGLIDYYQDALSSLYRYGFPESSLVLEAERVSDGQIENGTCGHFFESGCGHSTVNGDTYCESCNEDYLVWVDDRRHGGLYHRDDVYYWDSDGEYHLEPEPDEEEEEEDEDENAGRYQVELAYLNSWGTTTDSLGHDTSFVSSHHGDFIMGVELEVEIHPDYDSEERGSLIRKCNDYFNEELGLDRYAMFKKDGSLDEYRGFEIVTAARRLSDHKNAFRNWDSSDLIAWNADCCGMHVHIDSRAFSPLSLGKFLMFWNDPKNAEFIRSIAGRHAIFDNQAENYAALNGSHKNPAHAKHGAGNSRYRIVNLSNLSVTERRRLMIDASRDSKGSYSTVEIRAYRATLRKERLLAQLEFSHAAVVFCRVASNTALNKDGFISWLTTVIPVYPYLAKWLKVRKPKVATLRPAQQTRRSDLIEI